MIKIIQWFYWKCYSLHHDLDVWYLHKLRVFRVYLLGQSPLKLSDTDYYLAEKSIFLTYLDYKRHLTIQVVICSLNLMTIYLKTNKQTTFPNLFCQFISGFIKRVFFFGRRLHLNNFITYILWHFWNSRLILSIFEDLWRHRPFFLLASFSIQVLEKYMAITRSFKLKCQKISVKKLSYKFWTAMALVFTQ